jgi:hypothetical protein
MKQIGSFLKTQRKTGLFFSVLLVVLVCSVLIAPSLFAYPLLQSPFNLSSERHGMSPSDSLGMKSPWIWFTKPVQGNIYIMDMLELSAPGSTPFIVGPITFQVGLGREDETVWVVYSITTENGFPLLDPVVVNWREDAPGCDFYYNHIHLPLSAGNCFPIKCNIEAEVYWNELYMGTTNMTFFKIF